MDHLLFSPELQIILDVQEKISCTSQELHEWAKTGLISPELLEPGNQQQLIQFLKKNIKMLQSHYKSNGEEIYQIIIPPPDKWDETSELRIIDKRTGEIVNVLEQTKNFKLCDGISLKIKAKELPEWEKETSKAKILKTPL